jgi:hypothetical protein
MAKATNSRKAARLKRKGTTAAKRAAARKPVPRARKVSAKVTRLTGRPSSQRAQRAPKTTAAAGEAQEIVVSSPTEITKAPVVEPERTPPPLPVPIASFTF